MTILPKKKNSQAKGAVVVDGSEGVVENGQVVVGVVSHPGHSSNSESRAGLYSGGRTSPPRWPGSAREDLRGGPTGHPSATNKAYEEYESLDDEERVVVGVVGPTGADRGPTSGSSLGGHSAPCNSTQHKRRHRASPHRNIRKHREHRSGPGGGSSAAAVVVGGGLTNSPSTSCVGQAVSLATGSGGANNAGTSSATDQQSRNLARQQEVEEEEVDDDEEEDFSGYNSGDEYSRAAAAHARTEEEWTERERLFEKKLRKKGFIIKKMGEDGACLFRAVADQIYGDQDMHGIIRKHCMDYMAKNADYFSQYVTEDFDTYLQRKRLDHIHGNHVEIQALCEIYNRAIEVYHYTVDPINTFHGMHATDNEPIRISYHKNIHYNSIVDPYKATVGVGLGLPGFIPGLAEKNLMHDAVRQSEEFHIEQAMLEDKLKATDWEATNEAIEEQVARESYLQWLRDNDRRNHKATSRSATATCSSSGYATASTDIRSPTGSRSPRGRTTLSAGNSPAREEGPSYDSGQCSSSAQMEPKARSAEGNKFLSSSGANGGGNGGNTMPQTSHAAEPNPDGVFPDFRLLETASFINQLPPDVFGLTEWEDADILAQVLAASQQEYLDSLKRSAAAAAAAAAAGGSDEVAGGHSASNCGPSTSGSASSSSRTKETSSVLPDTQQTGDKYDSGP